MVAYKAATLRFVSGSAKMLCQWMVPSELPARLADSGAQSLGRKHRAHQDRKLLDFLSVKNAAAFEALRQIAAQHAQAES